MEAAFLKALNMSITAGWVVLAVILVRFLLRRAPKWIAASLWALVGIRLLCPFFLESGFSLIPSVQTVPGNILYTDAPTIHSGVAALNAVVNPVLSQSLAPNPGASVNPMQVIVAIASVIWIAGIAAMLLYTAVSYLSVRKRVSEAALLQENIWLCDHVDTPFILGVIRPRIFLPSALDGQEMKYVIAHEKAHLSRRDHWWKPLGFLLLTAYWFHPLLWAAYILFCRDIELACDERVIRDMGAQHKKPYSDALIHCSAPRRAVAACPLAFGEAGVKGRVKSVLRYKKPGFWVVAAAVIACVAAAVCFLTNPKESGREAGASAGAGTVTKWFDYLEAPEEMPGGAQLEIELPEFPGVTFRASFGEIEAVTQSQTLLLYTGMPIWSAYFCDLTGDGLPELCSALSFGSGMIDNRILIYDYVSGASYELADRGTFDYTLRLGGDDGRLYVDKRDYSGGELVSSGPLAFADDCIQILPAGPAGKDYPTYDAPDSDADGDAHPDGAGRQTGAALRPSVDDAQPETPEQTPEQAVSDFFRAFQTADYETMKMYCTRDCVDTYFHGTDVFGMVWAEAQTIDVGIPTEDGRCKVMVDVRMQTAETSALYPDTQTSFFVVLSQQESGWLIEAFVTG